uniref:Acetolactate synthase-1/2/3 large subunit n=1 Tax=Candidatus Kentrum sp. FW TaxID=2126338 RepID=A0A450S8L9_9GAMM|nr:MAG: acetolactate synthase-1/2/3 large subunit [Candidatus Kentron sp. FW]VFJ53524.1 MAG: acetolactate synthase-1/2/3 large subunit [Candidatus Kentron sp. FW]
MKEKSVAAFILEGLKKEGIDTLFLVPGGMLDPFMSAFGEARIQAITAAHEGGAAFMADGYARARGDFGVCMGIGGPGITNMVTAIASAYTDQSPVLVIGGTIPREWEGLGAVQDSSISGMNDLEFMRPVTAFAAQLPVAPAVPRFLKMSIRAMFGFERRPTFLSIPLFMQEETITADYEPRTSAACPRILDRSVMGKVIDRLKNAVNIVIFVGNGALRSNACAQIQEFMEHYRIPAVTTLHAKGTISEDHPLSFGVFGIGGSLQANDVIMGNRQDPAKTVPPPDVILALGVSLNEQNAVAMGDLNKSGEIIHVDINPGNLEDARYHSLAVLGDVREFLAYLESSGEITRALEENSQKRKPWLENIRGNPRYDSEADRGTDILPMHPARVLVELRKIAPRDTMVVVDSGAHTFFTAHHWTSYGPNQCLVWTNNGPMGYAVAAAIGAKLAHPESPCIAIIGDGGMMMHGMEIQTAARYNTPIVVLVLNNGALGNVYLRARRQNKEEAMGLTRCPVHDWVLFGQSLGAKGRKVEQYDQLPDAFREALSSDGPYIIDARCGRDYNTPNPGESALL